MKLLTIVGFVLLYFSSSLMASVGLEIGNGVVVETSGGIYVEIDGELNESGNGYFKGKISSGDRAALTSFAGMTLSTGIDGSIKRTTGSAYANGNGEGTNFLRYYAVTNSGSMVTADMQISFISSGNFDERNSLADPYYIYRYATNWNGYGEGAAASPLSASGVHILPGLTDWVISDNGFILFTDTEMAATGVPLLFNESAEGGDGHEVEMTFSSLTGSGNVTVQQTNRAPAGLPVNRCLTYFWGLSKVANITAFAASVSFNYLDSDLLDVTESVLAPAYYDDVHSEWVLLSDFSLNETTNTLTINNLDHFSLFAIGEPEAFSVTVSAKVFLEGPFLSGTMSTALLTSGYIPLAHPYGGPPWNYSGTESVTTVPADVVDWVLVELRSSTQASSIVATRAAFLKSDGDIVDLDGTSPVKFAAAPGDYYIVIHHRNHLSIMSADVRPINFSSAMYDFTTSEGQAYGTDAMKNLGGGVFGMYAGDGNADGSITIQDRDDVWLPQNGTAWDYNKFGDFTLDGGVDAIDYNLYWLRNNGTVSQVPLMTVRQAKGEPEYKIEGIK